MMNSTGYFINRDERYGNAELATVEDFRELNPDGEFEVRADGLYELIRITYGHNEWKRIADIAADPADVKPEWRNSVSTVGGMRWEDRYYGDVLFNAICSGVAIVTRDADYKLNGRVYHWELTKSWMLGDNVGGWERSVDGAKMAAIDAYKRFVNHAQD